MNPGYERLAVAILGGRTASESKRDCRPKPQHRRPKTAFERFAGKVAIVPDGCWEWTDAPTHAGYGTVRVDGKRVYAHRLSYELFIGPIPAGLFIDHLCRNRRCVRPAHLEPVTNRENIRRGYALRTHCPQGHPLSGDNLITSAKVRRCKTCAYASSAEYAAQKRRERSADHPCANHTDVVSWV